MRRLRALVLLVTASVPAHPAQILPVANQAVPPKSWIDGGRPKGFALDVAMLALGRAGCEVTVELFPLRRVLELTRRGQAALTGTFYTEERTAYSLFSEPMLNDELAWAPRPCRSA